MNKQIIMYALLGAVAGIVIVSTVLFVQIYKENAASVPQIKEDIAITRQIPAQEMGYQVPVNNVPTNDELKKIAETKQQGQRELAEVLEQRRQIAANVRAEIEASMNKETTPASEEKQAESTQTQFTQTQSTQAQSTQTQTKQLTTAPNPTKRTSTTLPNSTRFGQYYIHH